MGPDSVLCIRIRMDPHHFGNLESHPDPHQIKNPDLHQSDKLDLEPDPDPHQGDKLDLEPDPDPLQSDKLDPEKDPDSHQFADDKMYGNMSLF